MIIIFYKYKEYRYIFINKITNNNFLKSGDRTIFLIKKIHFFRFERGYILSFVLSHKTKVMEFFFSTTMAIRR